MPCLPREGRRKGPLQDEGALYAADTPLSAATVLGCPLIEVERLAGIGQPDTLFKHDPPRPCSMESPPVRVEVRARTPR